MDFSTESHLCTDCGQPFVLGPGRAGKRCRDCRSQMPAHILKPDPQPKAPDIVPHVGPLRGRPHRPRYIEGVPSRGRLVRAQRLTRHS